MITFNQGKFSLQVLNRGLTASKKHYKFCYGLIRNAERLEQELNRHKKIITEDEKLLFVSTEIDKINFDNTKSTEEKQLLINDFIEDNKVDYQRLIDAVNQEIEFEPYKIPFDLIPETVATEDDFGDVFAKVLNTLGIIE